eukprot:7683259-Alexandrium_andersonii.AAC.1
MPTLDSDEGEPVGSGKDRDSSSFAAAHARGRLGQELPVSLARDKLGGGHGRGSEVRLGQANEADAPL